MRRVAAACVLVLAGISGAAAENPEIASRRAAERKTFSDADIADGFLKTAFGAEFHLEGRVDRIRKYETPVRVYVESRAKPDRRHQVAAAVADIRAHVDHLDIAMTDRPAEANVTVRLVRDRDLAATIRAYFGRDRATSIQHSMRPQCLSGFRKDTSYRILHSDVILVADAGDFVFYDCVYEELLQSLGPINDTSSVPWTMFNDDVQMGFFDIYDQYILNILYDPRIRPGMTAAQARALLPQIMPAVRAWVARVNALAD
jgi:hypothetical protein